MNPHRCLTLAAAAAGVLGGLTATLARHLPSDQDLPVIVTSPQIQVDARYLRPGAESEYAAHAVCRCGPGLGSDRIPPVLKEALLAQEDTRFYIHSGIDWIGLGRAFASIASGGAIQGGSTPDPAAGQEPHHRKRAHGFFRHDAQGPRGPHCQADRAHHDEG